MSSYTDIFGTWILSAKTFFWFKEDKPMLNRDFGIEPAENIDVESIRAPKRYEERDAKNCINNIKYDIWVNDDQQDV